MRVVFEGLPGAGKTFSISTLGLELNYPIVPEWVCYSPQEWVSANLLNPFYRVNEEVKDLLARQFATDAIILCDRNYSGVLAYAYALSQVKGTNCTKEECYENEFLWYQQSIKNGTLHVPDAIIVLDIPAACSVQRQSTAQIFDPLFGNLKFLEEIRNYYSIFYKVIEPQVPFKIIDGTKPANQVGEQIIEFITLISRK